MPPISRGQVALQCGEQLRQIGQQLMYDPPERDQAEVTLPVVAASIAKLAQSCREAKSMYASMPKVRQAILDAGDKVSEIAAEVDKIGIQLRNTPDNHDVSSIGRSILVLGQQLKLVEFLPSPKQEVAL